VENLNAVHEAGTREPGISRYLGMFCGYGDYVEKDWNFGTYGHTQSCRLTMKRIQIS
jgi:hypothetical protein